MGINQYLPALQITMNDIFIGVPILLGCRGVEKVLEINLTDAERESLHTSAESVRQNIQQAFSLLGSS